MDSVPPIRRSAFEYIVKLEDFAMAETTAVAKALELPTVTVRRALEDLTAYGLVQRLVQGQGKSDLWAKKAL